MQTPETSPSDKTTLVEEGSLLKGTLSSTCPVIVRGRIEGDITAPALQVAVGGAVHGKVKVSKLVSQGELSGEFDADTAEISGVVKDNTVVRTKTLGVKMSAPQGRLELVFGQCVLEVGDPPSKEEAVARASEPDQVTPAGASPRAAAEPAREHADAKPRSAAEAKGREHVVVETKASSDPDPGNA